jgi:hypothetical protein
MVVLMGSHAPDESGLWTANSRMSPPVRDSLAYVLHGWRGRITLCCVKTLTVRLPEALVAEIEAESRELQCSKSDVVRERLSLVAKPRSRPAAFNAVADLVGSVDGLPADLSRRTKAYLKSTGYGRKRAR